MSQDNTTNSAPAFTELNPSSYRIRYIVVVAPLVDETICEQLEDDELCLKETDGLCCLCGTPTCYKHARKLYEQCFVHAGAPRPGGEICCICQQCDTLPRDIQETLYHFRRTLNGEEETTNGNG